MADVLLQRSMAITASRFRAKLPAGQPQGRSTASPLTTFDGHGSLIQTDFVVKNGAPAAR